MEGTDHTRREAHLDGPHRRQQALQLGVSGGRGEPLHRHDAGLRLALHHPQVLLVGHQASPAHRSRQAPASPVHEDLATTEGTVQVLHSGSSHSYQDTE